MKQILLMAAVFLISAGVSADDELKAREQAAQRVAGALLKELGGHLKAELERSNHLYQHNENFSGWTLAGE